MHLFFYNMLLAAENTLSEESVEPGMAKIPFQPVLPQVDKFFPSQKVGIFSKVYFFFFHILVLCLFIFCVLSSIILHAAGFFFFDQIIITSLVYPCYLPGIFLHKCVYGNRLPLLSV